MNLTNCIRDIIVYVNKNNKNSWVIKLSSMPRSLEVRDNIKEIKTKVVFSTNNKIISL